MPHADFSFEQVEQLVDRKVEALRHELDMERRRRRTEREERAFRIFIGALILAGVIYWTVMITLGVSGR